MPPSTPPPSHSSLPFFTTTTTNEASPIRDNSLFGFTNHWVLKETAATIQDAKRSSMDKKISVCELDFFMNKYIPPPSNKKEPKNLSTLKWGGPLTPENMNQAKTTVSSFNSWIKKVDNDDNAASPWDGEGYKVVVTASKADRADETKQRADLALYPSHSAPDQDEAPKWSAVEVFIECKPESVQDDPFDDSAENFQPSTTRRKGNLGQLMSYASLVFDHQHRKHQYTVVLFGEMARIVRWDRSGVTATEKFNYRHEPIKLARFFWRLCQMSAAQRGHDPTVSEVYHDSDEYKDIMVPRATEPIVDKATGIELGHHARLMFAETLSTAAMCYKMRLHDGERERSFLVGRPHFLSSELAGRGTRGYIAIDCSDPKGPFVYLKDAWRVDHDGIEREGDVLEYLNKEGVEGVPTLVCHGDIEDQVTDSQEVWKILHPDRQDNPLKTHRHYRMVVKEVCLSMSRFRNAKELVYLIATCVRAHGEAYKKGVIHRDVSAGNVLIHIKEKIADGKLVRTRVGLLTDWELSKRTDAPRTARQPDRTGTWQFMSVYTLNHPSDAIGIPEELESFFHILLYFAMRFFRHNCENVPRFMHRYFDGFEGGEGKFFCGVAKREAMMTGTILVEDGEQLHFDVPPDASAGGGAVRAEIPSSSTNQDTPLNTTHPLNTIFNTLLALFKARYALLKNSKVVAQNSLASAQRSVTPPTDEMDAWFAEVVEKEEPEGEEELSVPITQPATDKAKAELSDEQKKDFERQAAKLETHSRVLRLLQTFFNNKDESIIWPNRDKIPDQMRQNRSKEDGTKPAVPEPIAIPATSQGVQTRSRGPRTRSLGLPPAPSTASGSGTKRSTRTHDDENDDEPPAPKRKNPGAGPKNGKGRSRS